MIQKKIHRIVKYHSSRKHPVDKRSKILNHIVFTKNGLILGLKQLAGEGGKNRNLTHLHSKANIVLLQGRFGL